MEYLIKLVKDSINTKKYHALTNTQSRLSYLRSLAINTLIQEAARVFIENETAILQGKFHSSLLEKSNYTAQTNDIINLSIEKIYRSQEVIEKEIAGYQIISKLLDIYTKSIENQAKNQTTNFDKLIVNSFLKDFEIGNKNTYQWLVHLSSQVASLTDGNALRTFQKLSGSKLV